MSEEKEGQGEGKGGGGREGRSKRRGKLLGFPYGHRASKKVKRALK